jgi:hypothetical protein
MACTVAGSEISQWVFIVKKLKKKTAKNEAEVALDLVINRLVSI